MYDRVSPEKEKRDGGLENGMKRGRDGGLKGVEEEGW